MNGYQRPPLRLTFDAAEFQGLEVRARRFTVAEVRTIVTPGAARAEKEPVVLGILASAIRSWNLCGDDGEPIPPTSKNLDELVDRALVDTVLEELLTASTRVAPPLPKPSDGGSPSEEEFKLMADLSSDPPSSPGPS